jgi:hypothetical protein
VVVRSVRTVNVRRAAAECLVAQNGPSIGCVALLVPALKRCLQVVQTEAR